MLSCGCTWEARNGLTVIWTTHNLYQARRVADRVGLLWDGRLIEVAATREFFESPREPRTADFLAGRVDTRWVERRQEAAGRAAPPVARNGG